MCVYIYIYIYIYVPDPGLLRAPRRANGVCDGLEGTEGVPRNGGSLVKACLIAFYSQFFTCSNPHVDRCSNPLPWDPLSSPRSDGAYVRTPACGRFA